ncbi:MAG: hypothetical protein AAGE01_01375 [Pseudomonadota bacterium]
MRRRGQAEAGFVLPLTLLLLAAVTVVVSAFGLYAYDSAVAANRALDAARARVEMNATVESLRYALFRRRLTYEGFRAGAPSIDELSRQRRLYERAAPDSAAPTAIRFSGAVYQGVGDTAFAVYDDSALVGINPAGERIQDLLTLLGVDGATASALRDRLRDYVDEDELRRLNGGEAPDYEDEGLPQPRNQRLLNPLEAYWILGWEAALERAAAAGGRPLLNLTDFAAGRPNLNTSPLEVLVAVGALRDEERSIIVEQRPFTDISALSQVLGRPISLNRTEVTERPSTRLRVVLEHPGSDVPVATVFSLFLGGYNEEPWATAWTLRNHVFGLDYDEQQLTRPALLAPHTR